MAKPEELFFDYFHDKVVLANRVSIDEEELLEYIIDGIPDTRLRDQARMQCFRTKSNLLEAFKRLKFRYDFKTLNEKNNKFTKTNKEAIASKSEATTSKPEKTARAARMCYNCKKTGHISRNCRQLKKQTTAKKNISCAKYTTKEATAETSTNVIESTLTNSPFMIEVKYSISDNYNSIYDYKIMAMIDSSSLVSLIKDSYILVQARTFISSNINSYFGINNTSLTILDTSEIVINDTKMKFKFFIVPDKRL